MRVFQNIFARSAYLSHLDQISDTSSTFYERLSNLKSDGFNGVHLLEPQGNGENEVFLSCLPDKKSQYMWAKENGYTKKISLEDILLAQIEEFQPDIFYTQAPYSFGPGFLEKLPGCVRYKIGWHSPPAPIGNLTGYDLIVNNFPESLEMYSKQGVNTKYFTPSYCSAGEDAINFGSDRPIDITFVGGYTRHHLKRAAILESVAELSDRFNVKYILSVGRLTKLAESPLGVFPVLSKYFRPKKIRKISNPPVFGKAMYELFASSKIVLNGAVDLAGSDRGNMRCFEALSCGSLLLTDDGIYPPGMKDGDTMKVYCDAAGINEMVIELIDNYDFYREISTRGYDLIRDKYSKSNQWNNFINLVSG